MMLIAIESRLELAHFMKTIWSTVYKGSNWHKHVRVLNEAQKTIDISTNFKKQ